MRSFRPSNGFASEGSLSSRNEARAPSSRRNVRAHRAWRRDLRVRSSEPIEDPLRVDERPILFRQAVRGAGAWTDIGWRALTGESAKPVVRFMQDLTDFRKCTLFDSAGMERIVTPQDCVGVERAAVWEPRHIEARLLDYFQGRPNEMELRLRVRLARPGEK